MAERKQLNFDVDGDLARRMRARMAEEELTWSELFEQLGREWLERPRVEAKAGSGT
jgi:hypothetical protein